MAEKSLIAEIPVGAKGLYGSANQTTIPIDGLIVAENLTYEGGTVQKEGGASKYNSTAVSGAPQILGGHDWWPSSVVQRMVVATSAGLILKDSGTGTFPVTLASGISFSGDRRPVFVEGGKEAAANNRKLFCFIEGNATRVLSADGATMSALATPPADWTGTNHPSFGLIHDDKLWAGGNANDAHRLYYSDSTDHEAFTGGTSGSLSIYPGEGEKLVGAISWRGLLVAFKFPIGIYLVDTTDADAANWIVKRLSNVLGAIRPPHAVDDDVAFIDQSGYLRSLVATNAFGDASSRNLSVFQNIDKFIRTTLNLATSNRWCMQYYALKSELHIGCETIGNLGYNNARFVVDLSRPGSLLFRFSPRDNAISMWMRRSGLDQQLMMGDDVGFVWRLDTEARTKDSAGYTSRFQTPHNDLSYLDPALTTRRKNFRWLEIVNEPTGACSLAITVMIDGQDAGVYTFDIGTDVSVLGAFILGTSKLSNAFLSNTRKVITGSGRRISIRGENSAADENFSISKMFIHFGLSDQSSR
jgi:hypothetical protein